MRLSLSTVAILASMAPAAKAAVFMQCAELRMLPNVLSGVINAVTTTLSEAATFDGCRNHCAKDSRNNYSIYQPGIAGLLASCYCIGMSVEAEYVTKAKDPAGNCPGGSYAVSYLPSATWSFTSCATGASVSGGIAPWEEYMNEMCFKKCATFKYMVMTSTNDGSYMCSCGNTLTAGTPATCDKGVSQLYATGATPSGVARRNKIARDRALRNAKRSLCPESLTACIIPGTDSFECLDTSSELSSCGGCTAGVFGDAEPSLGVDCTTLAGIAPGAVSCEAGQCVFTV